MAYLLPGICWVLEQLYIKCILPNKVGNNLAVCLRNVLSLPVKTLLGCAAGLFVRHSYFPASIFSTQWKSSVAVFQKNIKKKG